MFSVPQYTKNIWTFLTSGVTGPSGQQMQDNLPTKQQ